MLKNKLKALVDKQHLTGETNFEIIHDSNALSIIGGVSTCPRLQSCTTYSGDCPNLTTCGTYTAPSE
jgi:hypothetical protein